nr:tubulointerstitial nephritis antigen-like [Cherax quadricarinatus]
MAVIIERKLLSSRLTFAEESLTTLINMTYSLLKKSRARRPTLHTQSLLVRVGLMAVTAVVVIPVVTAQFGSYSDLKGDYCRARRPESCCDGRYDDCSMPIRGTLCYCDQFCNRTINADCCPDYWQLCLGFRPAPIVGCNYGGLYVASGHSYKVNCNICKCVGNYVRCENDRCMMEEKVMKSVNLRQRHYGWRATNYSKFWGRKAQEGLVLRTGSLNPEVLGWYGSSWAFSTLGVTQDRLSIQSLGNETVRLSPQHLISCDRRGQRGCRGGHVDRAWQYLRKFG